MSFPHSLSPFVPLLAGLQFQTLFACLLLLSGIAYAALMFLFFVGWVRLRPPVAASDAPDGDLGDPVDTPGLPDDPPMVTVVVAARNEAGHIDTLLEAMENQTHPKEHFELIVVDDHSADETGRVVSDYAKNKQGRNAGDPAMNLRVIRAADHGSQAGKKHALSLGVGAAGGDVILTTDADCRPLPDWVDRMAAAFSDPRVQMVMGPVSLKGSGVWGQWQELEFLSLMGATGGAAGAGRPVMCNGANLGFRRDAWLQAGGYTANETFASGDDMFLMHQVKRQIKEGKPGDGRILFLKDSAAVVGTRATGGPGAFFRQRGRWAGKAAGYSDRFTLLTGALVAGFNLLLVIALLIWLVDAGLGLAGQPWINWQAPAEPFPGSAGQWIITSILLKVMADLLLLFSAAGFFKLRRRLWWFPVLFPVYPLYVLISLLVGQGRKNQW